MSAIFISHYTNFNLSYTLVSYTLMHTYLSINIYLFLGGDVPCTTQCPTAQF